MSGTLKLNLKIDVENDDASFKYKRNINNYEVTLSNSNSQVSVQTISTKNILVSSAIDQQDQIGWCYFRNLTDGTTVKLYMGNGDLPFAQMGGGDFGLMKICSSNVMAESTSTSFLEYLILEN
jgi:hypothetical protein